MIAATIVDVVTSIIVIVVVVIAYSDATIDVDFGDVLIEEILSGKTRLTVAMEFIEVSKEKTKKVSAPDPLLQEESQLQ